MKHLFVLLALLLSWSGAQAQAEKQTPVTKLPGEENLSLRERAERDFLMPVRRKKPVAEAPKVAEDNTAAPESDASAHYSEATDEAAVAAMPVHTTRSYEARHTAALASRRAAVRREESRAEARAEARASARRAARYSRSARGTKSKTHSKASSRSSKSKAKSTAHSKARKSTTKSKAASKKHGAAHSAKKVITKKGSARKVTAVKHKAKAKTASSKAKSKSKRSRR